MKRGDYVVHVRNPKFRGVIFDAWISSDGNGRGYIVWSDGTMSWAPLTNKATITWVLPGEPFSTPALKKTLRELLESDEKTAAAIAERREWLQQMTSPKRKLKKSP